MTTIGTPNNIEVLLWCHCRCEPHPRLLYIRDVIQELINVGAVTHRDEDPDGVLSTTPLGKAWVQVLCNVPPPKLVFVDEMGRMIS